MQSTAITVYSREEHCISRKNIDPDALKIMYRLIRHGFRAYLVGGGVRDLLLGKVPKDFDISTDATPKQVKSIFSNCRIIGRRFKLAHVYFRASKVVEVSTFRDTTAPIDGEEEQDGDAAVNLTNKDNKFGTPETDALRRDLTINGLFYDVASFSVIDYVGGMQDLKAGIIRVIGQPRQRFIEDPVRLIRAVRHAARTGFEIEPLTEQAIRENAALIRQCSAVRVYEELKKDLSSGSCRAILTLLGKFSLLVHLLPELCNQEGSVLDGDGPLTKALDKIDKAVRAGQPYPVTVVLSAIALYGLIQKLDVHISSLDYVRENEHLKEDLGEYFSLLAVPKKERMRIAELFGLLKRSLKLDPRRIGSMNFGKYLTARDLLGFIEFFDVEGELQEISAALRAPNRKRSQAQPKRQRHGAGQSSGRRRKPFWRRSSDRVRTSP